MLTRHVSKLRIFISILFSIILTGYLLSSRTTDNGDGDRRRARLKAMEDRGLERGSMNAGKFKINLALVACGELEYLQVLIKTAILFSQDAQLHLILLTDPQTMPLMKTLIQEIHSSIKELQMNQFTYEIHFVWFPKDGQSILSHVDSVIYLDVDNVILGNLSSLWSHFLMMDESQLLAAAPDTRRAYNSHKGFPFVPPTGINAGVLLMNLTRLRAFDFERKVTQIAHNAKDYLSDQDMLNILFHHNPQQFMDLSCSYNFWNGHCVMTEDYYDEELRAHGVYILHGASRQFPKILFRPYSLFSTTYKIMKNLDFRNSPLEILDKLRDSLNALYFNCEAAVTTEILLRNADHYFANLQHPANSTTLKSL